MSLLLSTECAQWRAGQQCRSTTGVRPYLTGTACNTCQPPHDPPPVALCRTCGTLLDPAAAAGMDGQPTTYDQHPGCDTTPRSGGTR